MKGLKAHFINDPSQTDLDCPQAVVASSLHCFPEIMALCLLPHTGICKVFVKAHCHLNEVDQLLERYVWGRCRCLSPSRLPFGSQRHSDAHQDMLQSLVGLHCASGHIISPGVLAYIHSGRASVSEGHHRDDTRETLAFSTSPSWNCVVVCPVHCSRQSSFAVLGETMLSLTSNPWDRMNP